MINRNLLSQRNTSLLLGLVAVMWGLFSATSALALGLSGGTLTFKGSVLSCTYGPRQGTVEASPGSAALGTPATYHEHSDNVMCAWYQDANNDGIPDDLNAMPSTDNVGHFALDVTYTLEGLCVVQDPNSGVGQEFQACGTKTDTQNPKHSGGSTSSNTSQAQCTSTTGTLFYQAFCGSNVTVEGTLKWVGAALGEDPPAFTGCLSDATPDECVMKLGDFVRNKKGQVDLSMCPYEFPDQTAAGGTLTTGEVLNYTETYASNSNCQGPLLTAGPASRRMCDNHSFDPNSTNGPCAPEKTSGSTFTFYSGGINPNDAMSVDAILLYDGQWQPNSTVNVGCSATDPDLNNGNIPTTVLNSSAFDTANIKFTSEETPVAYVKGYSDDTSPVVRTKNLTDTSGTIIGKGLDFDGCRGTNNGLNGLVQVICRHKDAWTKNSNGADQVVLSIDGTNTSGLGFTGNSKAVKLVGTCVE